MSLVRAEKVRTCPSKIRRPHMHHQQYPALKLLYVADINSLHVHTIVQYTGTALRYPHFVSNDGSCYLTRMRGCPPPACIRNGRVKGSWVRALDSVQAWRLLPAQSHTGQIPDTSAHCHDDAYWGFERYCATCEQINRVAVVRGPLMKIQGIKSCQAQLDVPEEYGTRAEIKCV
ncbi:uncharacterized protein UTRI_01205 [Ustilago trichophora]|uniref:Uncharacterized protein n=1 Tax=Ustilago trichophora TaxID=86804 RepID=A0A5C3DYZ3_9BASI|nr:uncharacterized protein UTRI_01205 [Ustilago trichophora]